MILLLGVCTALLTWRTIFLLTAKKPVLGHVVSSSFSDATRLSHRGWQRAMIGDALSAADAEPPTEGGTVRLRYTVDGRDYFTELPTVVRKGERPDPSVMLWYDPRDPGQASDKGISWLGLGMLYALLGAAILGVV